MILMGLCFGVLAYWDQSPAYGQPVPHPHRSARHCLCTYPNVGTRCHDQNRTSLGRRRPYHRSKESHSAQSMGTWLLGTEYSWQHLGIFLTGCTCIPASLVYIKLGITMLFTFTYKTVFTNGQCFFCSNSISYQS